MSWSLNGVGRPAAVLANLKADVARNRCIEPEQTIRDDVMHAIELALNAMPPSSAVHVTASGSQYAPDSLQPALVVNSLKVDISPLYGFAE